MGLFFDLKVFEGEYEGKLSSESFPSINTYKILYGRYPYLSVPFLFSVNYGTNCVVLSAGELFIMPLPSIFTMS